MDLLIAATMDFINHKEFRKLSKEENHLLLLLLHYRNNRTHECFPALTTLTEKIKLRKQNLLLCLKGLEEKGWVRRESGRGQGIRNQYLLQLPEIVSGHRSSPTRSRRRAKRRGAKDGPRTTVSVELSFAPRLKKVGLGDDEIRNLSSRYPEEKLLQALEYTEWRLPRDSPLKNPAAYFQTALTRGYKIEPDAEAKALAEKKAAAKAKQEKLHQQALVKFKAGEILAHHERDILPDELKDMLEPDEAHFKISGEWRYRRAPGTEVTATQVEDK